MTLSKSPPAPNKSFTSPRALQAWEKLERLALPGAVEHLRELLTDSQRSQAMSAKLHGLELDFSHQRVTPEVLSALAELGQASNLNLHINSLFGGERVNVTEQRAALHVALRGQGIQNPPWGEAIQLQVATELERICNFVTRFESDQLLGFGGEPFTDVVNLGIGGSALGPLTCVQALEGFNQDSLAKAQRARVHFVSNVDAWSLWQTLKSLNPRTTLFIVQSKTFTTQETTLLAQSAQRWLQDHGCPLESLPLHMVAVTARADLALTQGFLPDQTFHFWDWVGGRYSVWSAIGLPVALAVGNENFKRLLAGARAMDEHFVSAPILQNIPILMGLLGVWNRNFLQAPTHHIATYAYRLRGLTPYIQQLDMESNGKGTHVNGSPVQVQTAPIVWGGLGIDGQHAYFQLIHQGEHLLAVDFIGVRQDPSCPLPLAKEHMQCLHLSMMAQAHAMAVGRDELHTRQEMQSNGLNGEAIDALAPHRSFKGNTPSSSLWLEELDAFSLGMLMALYEHKTFVQATIWGINPFDQWGVELGKTMANQLAMPIKR